VIAETRDLDASFLAGLENGVCTVNFDWLVVNEYIEFVTKGLSSSEQPGLRSEEGLLSGAYSSNDISE